MLKAVDLKNLTKVELEDKLLTLKKELFDLRGQARVGKLEKSSQIRIARRDIAQVKTILNQGNKNESSKK